MKDPKFRAIREAYAEKLFEFIRDHANDILYQMESDEKYNSQETEIPKIPIFDNYLKSLESEIKKSVADIGYFNGTTTKLMNEYKDTFYYSSLPNLASYHNLEDKVLQG